MINPNLEFLIDDINIEKPEINSFKALWTVPLRLTYFEGHFPEKQILPGVAALDFTLALIQKIEMKPLFLKSVKSAKFLRPIEPNLSVELILSKKEGDRWRCQWRSREALLINFDLVLSGEITH